MGKNRKFKNSYIVTIEGTTTNGFQAQLFDNVIRSIGQAFGINSQQSSVSIKPLETEGDYDTEIRKVKEEAK
jgi:hypothetical protein